MFPNLISEASFHHFCHVLLVTQTILATVCVCVGGRCVCVWERGWCCYTKVPGGGNHGHHILQELHYFYFISQSAMLADSFLPL